MYNAIPGRSLGTLTLHLPHIANSPLPHNNDTRRIAQIALRQLSFYLNIVLRGKGTTSRQV